ncbi:MAG: DeoR family transcriptional regulator, partial [Pseudomonadota bacterium]
MSRNKDARQQKILRELELRPSLRVTELAERLRVSAETIRRDLDELTGEGLIDRPSGGAVRRLATEPAVGERHGLRVAERAAIARAACPTLKGARFLMPRDVHRGGARAQHQKPRALERGAGRPG